MPSLIEIVDDFVNKGRDIIDHIMSIQSDIAHPDRISEYKKLLLAASIDGYAGLVFPRKGSRDRYVRFIHQFGKWSDADRVSLIHLAELMRRSPEPEFDKLRSEVRRRMATLTTSPVDLSLDPHMAEIQSMWPPGKDYAEPLSGVTLDKLTHASLFYTYRCELAHQLQPPGFQWDALHLDDPYYIKSSDKVHGEWKQRYLLVYPLPFFHRRASECLASLDAYLKSNEIDPYDFASSGEFWLESLNK